jgi:hypothetical protein
MISPFHKDGNREPLNNEERSLVDGFVSALGFSMHKYDLVEKLVALTKMRTDKGKKRFTFLPNEEELRGMSPAKLQDISLRSAQVMLTETALVRRRDPAVTPQFNDSLPSRCTPSLAHHHRPQKQ